MTVISKLCATSLAVMLTAGSLSAQHAPTTELARVVGSWSTVEGGLRGRLMTTAYRLAERADLRIELELDNVSGSTSQVLWGDNFAAFLYLHGLVLQAVLENDMGAELLRFHSASSRLVAPPHWLAIPGRSSVRLPVSEQAYWRNQSGEYVQCAGWAWNVSPPNKGKLFLRVTLPAYRPSNLDSRLRRGPLVLPRVELPLAAMSTR